MFVRRLLPAVILAASAIVALRIALPPTFAYTSPGCAVCEADGCHLSPGEITLPVQNSREQVLKCLNFDPDAQAHCCKVDRDTYRIIDTKDGTETGTCYKCYCQGGTAQYPLINCQIP